jgi:hypothetical protein
MPAQIGGSSSSSDDPFAADAYKLDMEGGALLEAGEKDGSDSPRRERSRSRTRDRDAALKGRDSGSGDGNDDIFT